MDHQRPPPARALHWDVFARLIDNWGDVGVCWRLARQLSAAGHTVTLWLDDPSPLAWMAPELAGMLQPQVQVRGWSTVDESSASSTDALVEAFGCDVPTSFLAGFARRCHARRAAGQQAPAWLNLEYLTAEAFAERAHGLPSPQLQGPAGGLTKYFFYPGFSARTGGVLQAQDAPQHGLHPYPAAGPMQGHTTATVPLAATADQRLQRMRSMGVDIAPPLAACTWVSLFCYEPQALTDLLSLNSADPSGAVLLVAHGRTAEAVALARRHTALGRAWRTCVPLPLLKQTDYDQLLTLCDLNFVRGEDSLVAGLRAGRPLVWQAYVQDDGVHAAKVDAFLAWAQGVGNAPPEWLAAHRRWNGMIATPLPGDLLQAHRIEPWQRCARRLQADLAGRADLASQLCHFVATHPSI